MAKNTAECGKRDERELVKDLTSRGYSARRQPGSGNVDPTLPHDVVWEDSPIGKLLIECKWRANCGWRQLLTWMEGAPILSLKCDARRQQDGERYVFMKYDTFMALVGSAAERSEILSDLPEEGAQIATPDKPWLTEIIDGPDATMRQMSDAMAEVQQYRDKIQKFHKDAPPRKPKPRRLGG